MIAIVATRSNESSLSRALTVVSKGTSDLRCQKRCFYLYSIFYFTGCYPSCRSMATYLDVVSTYRYIVPTQVVSIPSNGSPCWESIPSNSTIQGDIILATRSYPASSTVTSTKTRDTYRGVSMSGWIFSYLTSQVRYVGKTSKRSITLINSDNLIIKVRPCEIFKTTIIHYLIGFFWPRTLFATTLVVYTETILTRGKTRKGLVRIILEHPVA